MNILPLLPVEETDTSGRNVLASMIAVAVELECHKYIRVHALQPIIEPIHTLKNSWQLLPFTSHSPLR